MPKTELGALLISRGLISRPQLDRALERQREFGGRLGTCLMEIGALGEDVLLSVLSGQLGVPHATRSDLASVPPELLALLPASTALNCSAVPFRLSADRVDIALLDPGDLALEDELSFSLGRRIHPHLATELRIVEALHRHYGGAIPLRFRHLLDHEHPGPKATAPQAKVSPVPQRLRPGSEDEGSSHQPHFAPPPAERRSIALTQEERDALAASRGSMRVAASVAHDPEASASKLDSGQFGQMLSEAETASQIGAALLDSLSKRFPRVLLYRVSSGRDEVSGWTGRGDHIDAEWLRHYSVGLHQATVFRELAGGVPFFAGHLEATPAHVALARCWDGSLERECLFLPVKVRGRLVCAVYVDQGGAGLSSTDLDLLKRVGKMASLAFERCILRRKLQTT